MISPAISKVRGAIFGTAGVANGFVGIRKLKRATWSIVPLILI
jgi:hypothetical protein